MDVESLIRNGVNMDSVFSTYESCPLLMSTRYLNSIMMFYMSSLHAEKKEDAELKAWFKETELAINEHAKLSWELNGVINGLCNCSGKFPRETSGSRGTTMAYSLELIKIKNKWMSSAQTIEQYLTLILNKQAVVGYCDENLKFSEYCLRKYKDTVESVGHIVSKIINGGVGKSGDGGGGGVVRPTEGATSSSSSPTTTTASITPSRGGARITSPTKTRRFLTQPTSQPPSQDDFSFW